MELTFEIKTLFKKKLNPNIHDRKYLNIVLYMENGNSWHGAKHLKHIYQEEIKPNTQEIMSI